MLEILVVLAAAAAQTPTPTPTPAARPALPGKRATAEPPRGKSLAEVARSIKLRLPAGRDTVITNESLRELAAGVELTTAAELPQAVSGEDPAAREEASKKAYWQERYFLAQRELAELESEERQLSEEVARLERDFYARDDPYQRDNVVKPAWDAAVMRLREVQERLPVARQAPEAIANEGRRDGALPGWFRERPPQGTTGRPVSPDGPQ